MYWDLEQCRAAYAAQPPGPIKLLLDIGLVLSETPAGMTLFGHWNKTFLPEFQGTPLDELFRDRIEPFVAAMRAELIAAGELPSDTD